MGVFHFQVLGQRSTLTVQGTNTKQKSCRLLYRPRRFLEARCITRNVKSVFDRLLGLCQRDRPKGGCSAGGVFVGVSQKVLAAYISAYANKRCNQGYV